MKFSCMEMRVLCPEIVMSETSMHEVVSSSTTHEILCGDQIMPGAEIFIFMHEFFMPQFHHAWNHLYESPQPWEYHTMAKFPSPTPNPLCTW